MPANTKMATETNKTKKGKKKSYLNYINFKSHPKAKQNS